MGSIRSNKAKVIFNHMTDTLDDELGLFIERINREVQDITPVRTGTAQRGWHITNKFGRGSLSVYNNFGSISIIENKVPYIGLLDEGYSVQAKNGIVLPTFNKFK
jgi:hypothetical protein